MVSNRWILVWGLLGAACSDSPQGEGQQAHSLDGAAGDGALADHSDGAASQDADLPDGGQGVDAAELSDGGDVDADAEVDAAAGQGAPVADPEHTGFVAYGQLRLAFAGPIVAADVTVALSPVRPTGLAVVQVAQAGTNALLVSLNANHLPIDYTATVSGAGYSLSVSIPGAGNGSRTAFASRHKGSGDLRTWMAEAAQADFGREAGDIICQAEADAAGLKGSFRALLSSNQAGDVYDAACRAMDRVGTWDNRCGLAAMPADSALWIDQDGLPLAQGAEAIARGHWLMPLRYYADGQRNDVANHGWTGSDEEGRATNSDCLGFTSALEAHRGAASAQVPNYLLNSQYRLDCASTLQIVCVQTGTGFFATSTVHKQTGKAVFVTPSDFTATSLDAAPVEADAFCQAAAQGAGYATYGNFVAWLSSPTSRAVCRLVGGSAHQLDRCGLSAWPSARWVRVDGLLIADGIPELLSGRLRAPVLLMPDGSRGGPQDWVQTYTSSSGAYGSCNAGHVGSVTGWTLFGSHCASRSIMCFER